MATPIEPKPQTPATSEAADLAVNEALFGEVETIFDLPHHYEQALSEVIAESRDLLQPLGGWTSDYTGGRTADLVDFLEEHAERVESGLDVVRHKVTTVMEAVPPVLEGLSDFSDRDRDIYMHVRASTRVVTSRTLDNYGMKDARVIAAVLSALDAKHLLLLEKGVLKNGTWLEFNPDLISHYASSRRAATAMDAALGKAVFQRVRDYGASHFSHAQDLTDHFYGPLGKGISSELTNPLRAVMGSGIDDMVFDSAVMRKQLGRSGVDQQALKFASSPRAREIMEKTLKGAYPAQETAASKVTELSTVVAEEESRNPDTETTIMEAVRKGRAEGLSDLKIYRALSRIFHPDVAERGVDGEEAFKKLGGLYDPEAKRFQF